MIQISAGVSNGDKGFGPGNEQRNGKSRRPHHTVCRTGEGTLRSASVNTVATREALGLLIRLFTVPGDAGIVGVPGSVCVLLLLPVRCRRLLRAAHRDHRTGPAGVQPAPVGPGDGGPRLVPQLRQDPPFLLGVAGLTLAGDLTDGRPQRRTKKQTKKKQDSQTGLLCPSPVPS